MNSVTAIAYLGLLRTSMRSSYRDIYVPEGSEIYGLSTDERLNVCSSLV